jgi:hypothetical protein
MTSSNSSARRGLPVNHNSNPNNTTLLKQSRPSGPMDKHYFTIPGAGLRGKRPTVAWKQERTRGQTAAMNERPFRSLSRKSDRNSLKRIGLDCSKLLFRIKRLSPAGKADNTEKPNM